MRPLRAGVVGLGTMGRNHARLLRDLDGVELVAAVDPAARDGGGVPVLARLEQLLERGLDLCVVAAPTPCHEEVGVALAAAGVPTLIEKPVAPDPPAARRLIAAFASAGVLGCVGHVERYNPALLALRARLLAGELGTLHAVATRRRGPTPERLVDVGVVMDLATHDLDLTTWLCQSPYRSLTAHTAFRVGRTSEDLVAAIGRLADGTVTSHLADRLTPTKERRVTVTGERGCLVADTLNRLLLSSDGDPLELHGVDVRHVEPLAVELAAFRDAVLGRPAEVVTLSDGLAAVLAAQALLDSACFGDTMKLDDPT